MTVRSTKVGDWGDVCKEDTGGTRRGEEVTALDAREEDVGKAGGKAVVTTGNEAIDDVTTVVDGVCRASSWASS